MSLHTNAFIAQHGWTSHGSRIQSHCNSFSSHSFKIFVIKKFVEDIVSTFGRSGAQDYNQLTNHKGEICTVDKDRSSLALCIISFGGHTKGVRSFSLRNTLHL